MQSAAYSLQPSATIGCAKADRAHSRAALVEEHAHHLVRAAPRPTLCL